MTTPDITLHQLAPIIGAIMDHRRQWDLVAEEHDDMGEHSAARLARSKAEVIDATLQLVINAATGYAQ